MADEERTAAKNAAQTGHFGCGDEKESVEEIHQLIASAVLQANV